jgi:hypothetical protein
MSSNLVRIDTSSNAGFMRRAWPVIAGGASKPPASRYDE